MIVFAYDLVDVEEVEVESEVLVTADDDDDSDVGEALEVVEGGEEEVGLLVSS